MAAYVVFIREGEVADPEMMAAYKAAGSKPSADPAATPLVVYGALETIEGAPADGMVILRFETMQDARDWYNGDYNERAKLRQQAAPYRGFIVEGL